MSDVLVVYYSRSGTTETAARRLANILDADLDEVVALQGYDGILGFLRCVYQAGRRERPDIATGKDPSQYRLVIVGSPVWAGRLAAPLRTYLDRHREALSAVAAFCTSESGDGRPVFEQMDAQPSGRLQASVIRRSRTSSSTTAVTARPCMGGGAVTARPSRSRGKRSGRRSHRRGTGTAAWPDVP
ncbi:flavodoxin family protein [Brevundimonas sp.]|uniref:flavodoxin family protein n=1 Tax=Brevundimonas sp. TaxID=1871086 RepID=UPI0035ADB83A